MSSRSSQKRIWISWENQRRSVELSKSFNCSNFIIIEKGYLRYLLSIIKTFKIIQHEKPDVLFVQNPSIILAFFATCVFKYIFKYFVVVDRHSNFLLVDKRRNFLFEIIFHFISYLTIRFSDLTIVTNIELFNVVDVLGGRASILPDKIPSIIPSKNGIKLVGDKNILIISSFADDEPIQEIVLATDYFTNDSIIFYFSGDFNKYSNVNQLKSRKNIVTTGFIDEQDFVDIVFSVDIVIVLTTMKYTLLCGCYEAIAAGKVLITSDTITLRSLFDGAIFVQNKYESITGAIQYSLDHTDIIKERINELKNSMQIKWESQYNEINDKILKYT